MSRAGSILLFISGLALFIGGALRAILGDWQDFLFIPLILFVVCIITAIVKDIGFYKELFTMRTTKYGMNMGVMILLSLALLVIINITSVRMDKNFDVTKEHLNSLSDQSKDVLAKIDSDLTVTVFFSGKDAKDQKGVIGEFVKRYQDQSARVKIRYIDARKRPDLAAEYKLEETGLAAFIDYKDKKIRVDLDKINEEGITNAMVKASRTGEKKILFISGHNERANGNEEPEQIGIFRKSLEDASYVVKDWNLVQEGKIPADTNMVVMAGPQTYLMPAEIEALKDYGSQGGKIFVAADPEHRHNIKELAKIFGIDYHHNYVVDNSGILLGQRPGMVPIFNYSTTDEITRKFPKNALTLFDQTSVLSKDSATSYTVEKLAWTHPATTAVKDPTVENGETGSFAVMMSAKGKLSGSPSGSQGEATKDSSSGPSESKDFVFILAGDSDFLTNMGLRFGMNRDLGLNVVASLLKETDMITIRPKQPMGSMVNMTQSQFMILIFTFIIPLPLILFSLGGFIWWRRRAA